MHQLYLLIKSLDANERKYFKRFGIKDESKGKSNTLKLFEIFEEADKYDEEKILYRIKRDKLDKQLASLKHYLNDLLLDNLVWYHKDGIPGLDTSLALGKMKILEGRGMDAEAGAILEKISRNILHGDAFVERWNILSRRIVSASNDFLSSKKYEWDVLDDLLQQREMLLEQMKRCHEYEVLLTQQLRIMRKSITTRTDEDLRRIQQIYTNPLIADEQNSNSDEAKFLRHTILVHHHQITGNPEELYKATQQLITLLNQGTAFAAQIMRRLWAYSQLTQACYFTQRWNELEQYLAELKAIETITQTESIAQFTYYAQLAITLYDNNGRKDELQCLLKECSEKLDAFGNNIRPDVRLAISITVASALVEYGDYNAAIELCENFLTHYDSGVRLDALLMLYVYELIAHLETGNMLYVNNTIQNVYRYFLRNKYKNEFETTLLRAFKKLSEVQDYVAHSNEIKKLKEELEAAAGDVSNRQHLALLPVVQSFIDAKLQGVPIHDFAAKQRGH